MAFLQHVIPNASTVEADNERPTRENRCMMYCLPHEPAFAACPGSRGWHPLFYDKFYIKVLLLDIMAQLTPGINLLTSFDSDTKIFIAFEKRQNNPETDGIYYNEIDKNSNTQIPDPYGNTAKRVIKSEVYNGNIVEKLKLYANRQGTEATITIVVRSGSGNQRIMHTGRIINREYHECDTPNTLNGEVIQIEAHYISKDKKFKVYVLKGGLGGGWEGH